MTTFLGFSLCSTLDETFFAIPCGSNQFAVFVRNELLESFVVEEDLAAYYRLITVVVDRKLS